MIRGRLRRLDHPQQLGAAVRGNLHRHRRGAASGGLGAKTAAGRASEARSAHQIVPDRRQRAPAAGNVISANALAKACSCDGVSGALAIQGNLGRHGRRRAPATAGQPGRREWPCLRSRRAHQATTRSAGQVPGRRGQRRSRSTGSGLLRHRLRGVGGGRRVSIPGNAILGNVAVTPDTSTVSGWRFWVSSFCSGLNEGEHGVSPNDPDDRGHEAREQPAELPRRDRRQRHRRRNDHPRDTQQHAQYGLPRPVLRQRGCRPQRIRRGPDVPRLCDGDNRRRRQRHLLRRLWRSGPRAKPFAADGHGHRPRTANTSEFSRVFDASGDSRTVEVRDTNPMGSFAIHLAIR